jgi:hypothetical protein
LYAGAVASALSDSKNAEKLLNRAIKMAPDSEVADEAHGQLAYLYARLSRNRKVVQQFDRMLQIKPGREELRNARALFAAFSRYPDQSVGKRRFTSVRGAEVSKDGLVIPLSINGKAVNWGIDTGMNISIIGDSEARMLGLTVDNEQAQVADMNGGTTPVRTTIVNRLAIGEVEVRNVPFMVLPDSQPPMNLLPPGKRGYLGLPVVVALQAISWTADGTFEIGFPPGIQDSTRVNLCFDGLAPIVRVQFQGRALEFLFDTGNGAGTQLWDRFGEEFKALLKEHGTKSTKKVTQVGGSIDREATVLPELRLSIGKFDTVLKPAFIFSKPVGNDSQYGLFGMDLLSQAREVKVDFRSMTILLLP